MMKVKRLIVSLCCFVLALFSTGTYAEKIPVNKNWEDTLGVRSLSSSPTLLKEGIYFSSCLVRYWKTCPLP